MDQDFFLLFLCQDRSRSIRLFPKGKNSVLQAKKYGNIVLHEYTYHQDNSDLEHTSLLVLAMLQDSNMFLDTHNTHRNS